MADAFNFNTKLFVRDGRLVAELTEIETAEPRPPGAACVGILADEPSSDPKSAALSFEPGARMRNWEAIRHMAEGGWASPMQDRKVRKTLRNGRFYCRSIDVKGEWEIHIIATAHLCDDWIVEETPSEAMEVF